jgi:hypothetical protein
MRGLVGPDGDIADQAWDKQKLLFLRQPLLPFALFWKASGPQALPKIYIIDGCDIILLSLLHP